MHTDDLLGPSRRFGDAPDRNGGRVGREHRPLGRRGLHLPQHLPLYREILEHRFDDQVGAPEARVGVRARQQRPEPGVLVLRQAASLQPVIQDLARPASPFATRGRSASFIRTSTPAWTTAVPAIPDPMNPEPTTPRRRTSAGWGGLGTPKSFLSWLVAKKIWTSLRETSVTAS